MRKSMAAYEAKPERIEDGLKVNHIVHELDARIIVRFRL